MAINSDYVEVSEAIYTSLTKNEPDDAVKTIIRIKLNKLSQFLRDDIDETVVEVYKETICYTAALMAAYDLSVKDEALYQRPVKIGDISYEAAVGSEGLKALINENMSELSPLIKDKGFLFEVME